MPRLFVGQVPTDKAEQDLYPLFAPYGTVEKITMVRGPEGKSRGCAMVQFKRWAEAEAAMDALNGTSPLEGGKGRPLVVHFANPRRPVGNQATEPAIAPRKLFVGQVRAAGRGGAGRGVGAAGVASWRWQAGGQRLCRRSGELHGKLGVGLGL